MPAASAVVTSPAAYVPAGSLDSPICRSPPQRAAMETIHRLLPISAAETLIFRCPRTLRFPPLPPKNPSVFPAGAPTPELTRRFSNDLRASAGWFSVFGTRKRTVLPEIVKAGDPILHEPAGEVPIGDIGSERIQRIIDDMISVMRKAPGVGLAAPQIGVPLKIIVLEDTKEYISYAPKNEIEAQGRHPFDLLVIVNPKMKKRSNKTALFFEGCLSVDGFRAVVERYLEVEVSGLGRDGRPSRVDATGWQARILQHECDHLDGTLYVDKMVPRTFRTVENLDLPLPEGCPLLGVR